MNNYKFRGKSAINGNWIYGVGIKYLPTGVCLLQENNINDNTFMEVWHSVLSETVGQWTGLKDKNGKEIYEGDIIKHRTAISLVVNDFFYDACDFLYKGFFLKKIKSSYGYCLEFDKTNPEYEIIGNKFNNPELMEDK